MSNETKSTYIFDLDGTLALVDHRRPLIEQSVTDGDKQHRRPDWHSFNKASLLDPPNTPVVQVLQALHRSGYEIWIVSARSDAVELETRGWLTKYDVPFHRLIMRSAADNRVDHLLKSEWAKQYDFVHRAIAVFDDRTSVVSMWRELGIPCFQVAPGDF